MAAPATCCKTQACSKPAITKQAVTGSQFTIRHNVDYDANNAPGNAVPSAWNTNVEAEIRQPLLQGAGVQFNRIAGPLSQPGVYNGVLVARINTDVALTDFEIAVRDLMSNLENSLLGPVLRLPRFGRQDQGPRRGAQDVAERLRAVRNGPNAAARRRTKRRPASNTSVSRKKCRPR